MVVFFQKRKQLPAEGGNVTFVNKKGRSGKFRQTIQKVPDRQKLVSVLLIDQTVLECENGMGGIKFRGGFQFYLDTVFLPQNADPVFRSFGSLAPELFAGAIDIDRNGTIF